MEELYSQLLNVHNVSDAAEPLVPGPGCLVFEITIAELKKYK
jgi:hypothetical protein